MPPRLVFLPDHEAGDVLQEHAAGSARLHASSMKCVAFSADSEKRMPLFASDADRVAVQVREAGDQRRAVVRLELVELASRRRSRAMTSRTSYGFARVRRNHAVDFFGRVERLARLAHVGRDALAVVELGDDAPHDRERVRVVQRVVIGDAGDARVHVRCRRAPRP